LVMSCNNSPERSNDTNASKQGNYGSKDGYYCSTVTYFNPNTGKSSNYTLTVEVNNHKVIKILWPNGGWLDDSHFTPEEIDEAGAVEFVSDKGYQYKVRLDSFGVCPVK
jgi:hypothetical protein